MRLQRILLRRTIQIPLKRPSDAGFRTVRSHYGRTFRGRPNSIRPMPAGKKSPAVREFICPSNQRLERCRTRGARIGTVLAQVAVFDRGQIDQETPALSGRGDEQVDYSNGDVEMTIDNSSVQVLGIDAGGTMTDTFFVRADGRFVVGKAQSNPGDESLAIYNSSVDALAHWGREVDDVYPELVTCVYSGTAMVSVM